MSHVDLGYSQDCEPWQVESYSFPSKIGGKPAWLDLENLPKPKDLECGNCHQPLIFLCQIYAPFEEDAANFHRTIFVFLCRDSKCCLRNSNQNVRAFRSSLPRQNKFYSSEPPEDKRNPDFSPTKWVKFCELCGCLGEKKCSKCKKATYCSREHQIIDWKGHKNECEKEETPYRFSSKLFPELEIVIEAEEIEEKNVDESEELKKFNQMKDECEAGTMDDVTDSDIEKYAIFDTDKVFTRFKECVSHNAEQILRYERSGEPLWIASEPRPDVIPNCEYCGGLRQYEFQIMPQLLAVLHENDLDIGVIVVYTCSKSCIGGDNYKKEFVFKQDVAINS